MDQKGLTTAQAKAALDKYGLNEIPEKRENLFKKIFKYLISPISLMFIAALVVTKVAHRTFDFYIILFLFFLNFFISFWQERKADNAIESLRRQLEVNIKVLRDGKWGWLNAKFLVPGDIFELVVGDIVPTDAKIIEGTNIAINEAALTGESLPKEKNVGDKAYSGSFMTTGFAKGEVIATGPRTEFGKTILLIEKATHRSVLEEDILSITKMIAILSIFVMAIITVVFLSRHAPVSELLLVDLGLLIAGIPISLPTVMTIIIALGVTELAKKSAIVRRLSSLENLANVNLLLTDKTGTLSKNELRVEKIITYGKFTQDDLLNYAASAAFDADRSEIDRVLLETAKDKGLAKKTEIVKIIPADSERKRVTAIVKIDGKKVIISVGAPQIIESLCSLDGSTREKYTKDLSVFSNNGYRSISLAISFSGEEEKNMELAGIFAIADTIRPDAKEVIDFMKANGIDVKMVTGDNRLISNKVALDLGLSGGTANSEDFKKIDWNNIPPEWFKKYSVFSEVLPIDKFHLVQYAKNTSVVAVTGDGVNDLPALKASDVGIAVSNAVNALKGAADIILLKPGISVIKDALIEARRIFVRLYVYSVYRISESFRVIVTIGVLGIVIGYYPLTAVQLIILALMNDIPIISLAFNRVKTLTSPAKIKPRKRLLLGSLLGLGGIANSLILFFILKYGTDLSSAAIQTIYFLKLTVSGHMLIYVAHTKQRWYKFLPSKQVIIATFATQFIASAMAGFGIFMSPISFLLILMVWAWSFLWMQISEVLKYIPDFLEDRFGINFSQRGLKKSKKLS